MDDAPSRWVSIGISALSLVLASLALGWNVYRDVVLKARVAVRFLIVGVMGDRSGVMVKTGEYLDIRVVNHGPGSVTIQGIAGKVSPWWRTLLRRPQHFVILNDHTNPLNPRLPKKLDVGESISLLLPHDERCFLAGEATHIGVTDSFGRSHLAPGKDVRAARRLFLRALPKSVRAQNPNEKAK